MKKMHVFITAFTALFISISFCPPAFAQLQKFPLNTTHFWFWYSSHLDWGGPAKELIGGLRLSTLSNSGTFIIEQKGTNITLSVKGIPYATWTYSGINFYRFWLDTITSTQPSGKIEVDILSISREGVEVEPPGGPKPPPPPFTH